MLLTFLGFIVFIISVLVNVAFITLVERKILGLSQARKGPDKVSFLGLLQPLSDAIKLVMKEMVIPFKSNSGFFLLAPMALIFLALGIWPALPYSNELMSIEFSGVLLLVILGFGVFPLLLSGWSSNSKYALLGAMRGVAQSISYEIALALILFSMLLFSCSLCLHKLNTFSSEMPVLFLSPALTVLWLISCFAETNRTPFDFAEGESELVSGFNVEYSGGGFTLIFMAEYSMILFFCFLTPLLLVSLSIFFSLFMSLNVIFLWMWTRSTLPRYRYDKLMSLAWKTLLPISLTNLLFIIILV